MDKSPLPVNEILALTTDIVAAHVANNSVAPDELPGLIENVFGTLNRLHSDPGTSADAPKPAVPIKKSITPEFIICLEDGKKLKMLKRHLRSQYDMSPEEYRERWGLGADYPMVAPNYADQRRLLAKKIGLGRGRKKES